MSSPSISDTIQDLMEELLRRMGVAFDKVIVQASEDNTYRANILSEDASLLIGHFGDTLAALQYVVKAVMGEKRMSEEPLFIICDVEGYKERQEEKVKQMADKAVEQAKESGNEEHLPAMSPYFRKIVHMYLINKYESDGIRTESEGEGDDRHIVVKIAT